jgi:hypothetical protein
MLTADVVQSLEQDGAPCPAAVSQLDLSDPGVATSAQVWGRDGLVRFSDPGNDVFWTAVDGAWRVTAAGCTRNADAPADCELEAG